jgi:hypothetical protein
MPAWDVSREKERKRKERRIAEIEKEVRKER